MHPSFRLGFEKLAFNLADARKAYIATVKPKHIRASISMNTRGEANIVRRLKPKDATRNNMPMGPVSTPNAPSQATRNRYQQIVGEKFPTRTPHNIIASGDARKTMGIVAPLYGQEGWVIPKGTPQQREMLNRTSLLHEASEIKHSKKYKAVGPGFAGHTSPEVIIEESNMIATMPKEHKDYVGNLQRRFREVDNSSANIASAYPGFTYGQTRLNRHDKKRISNKLKASGVFTPLTDKSMNDHFDRVNNIKILDTSDPTEMDIIRRAS